VEGPAVLVPVSEKLELFKVEHPKRMLTFELRRKAKLFDPPQGGHRINLRCNWMFDNEIDWVKKITRLSRPIPGARHEEQYRKFVMQGKACLVECL